MIAKEHSNSEDNSESCYDKFASISEQHAMKMWMSETYRPIYSRPRALTEVSLAPGESHRYPVDKNCGPSGCLGTVVLLPGIDPWPFSP
jgi:hypothetical protein